MFWSWNEFSLAQPWWLLALLLLPLVAWMQGGRRGAPAVKFSTVSHLRRIGAAKPSGWGGIGRPLLLLGLALLIVAMARPRLGKSEESIESSGVDIMLTLDASGSMQEDDFTIDGSPASRMDAVKLVAKRFVEGRPNDRIGLVLFAVTPFVLSPATLDHKWLAQNIDLIQANMFQQNGTYIAAAVASSASRLDKNKKAKSKLIILLTDGAQNTGNQDPVEAAQAAAKLGIKIYTIGAGGERKAPQASLFGFGRRSAGFSPADEDALRKIAEAGNGKFFRAADTSSLANVFDQIDKLEKTEVKLKKKMLWQELFHWFVAAGCALLAIRAGLAYTAWRTLP